jgi:hypothetical protein
MNWFTEEEIQETIKEMKEEEEKEKRTNVLPFTPRLLTGGKGPTDCWLLSLPINTIFLTRPVKWDKPFLEEYKIIRKTEKSVQLYSLPYLHSQQGFLLVDPIIFCKTWELVEVLGEEPMVEDQQ